LIQTTEDAKLFPPPHFLRKKWLILLLIDNLTELNNVGLVLALQLAVVGTGFIWIKITYLS
jgi:hypothetical protein